MTRWHEQRQAVVRCGWCGSLVDYPGPGFYLRHRGRYDHWYSTRRWWFAVLIRWAGLRPLVIWNADRIRTGRR